MTIGSIAWKILVMPAGICFAAMMIAASSPAAQGQAQEQATDGAPRLVNAQKETQALNGSLAGTVQSLAEHADKSEWIGYGVPQVAESIRRAAETMATEQDAARAAWKVGIGESAPTRTIP